MQISLSDYRTLAAVNREDLVLWGEAEAQRMGDEVKLRQQEKEGEG